MEAEDVFDLDMIKGRLKTITGMRVDSQSPFLPMAKLEVAIETLQKSQTELFQARTDIQLAGRSRYPGVTIENVDEYLARVMDELEILETQHSLLLQEVPDNIPPPAPARTKVPDNIPPPAPAWTSSPGA